MIACTWRHILTTQLFVWFSNRAFESCTFKLYFSANTTLNIWRTPSEAGVKPVKRFKKPNQCWKCTSVCLQGLKTHSIWRHSSQLNYLVLVIGTSWTNMFCHLAFSAGCTFPSIKWRWVRFTRESFLCVKLLFYFANSTTQWSCSGCFMLWECKVCVLSSYVPTFSPDCNWNWHFLHSPITSLSFM